MRFIRKYVENDPSCNPNRRRFQVGDKVVVKLGVSRVAATVISLDRRYYRINYDRPGEYAWKGADSMYTIRYGDTGRTRRVIAYDIKLL